MKKLINGVSKFLEFLITLPITIGYLLCLWTFAIVWGIIFTAGYYAFRIFLYIAAVWLTFTGIGFIVSPKWMYEHELLPLLQGIKELALQKFHEFLQWLAALPHNIGPYSHTMWIYLNHAIVFIKKYPLLEAYVVFVVSYIVFIILNKLVIGPLGMVLAGQSQREQEDDEDEHMLTSFNQAPYQVWIPEERRKSKRHEAK